MSVNNEEKYARQSVCISFWNFLVAVISLIGVFFGTIFAYQAMEATRIQADDATLTMRMNTRPWLSASYKLKSVILGMKIDGDDSMRFRGRLEVSRDVTISNNGNVPAVNVSVISRIYPDEIFGKIMNPIDEEKALCRSADREATKVGFAVFPGKDYVDAMEDSMFPEDFEKTLPSRSFMFMHIVYCIRYEFASFVGHTGFEMVIIPNSGVNTPMFLDGNTLDHTQFRGQGPNNIPSYVD
ncbi:hypothetical protein GOB93_14015 [Acetobacter musti]|uniref:Uncharacterized protein n=1 Tax=Acetobacter musti TaxID=864732 RepID=A0ABX0JW80_9PROT|nr:hypothetical protein [Acetobacter musti]NHN85749.1 hypothetical protein [Acetobacter musti]